MKKKTLYDEIDLLEIIKILWSEKWKIILFISISLIITFFLVNNQKQKYKVIIPYSIKILPTNIINYCEGSERCKTNSINNNFIKNFEKDLKFKISNKNLSFITTDVINKKEYLKIFNTKNEEFTSIILKDELKELNFIENELKNSLTYTPESLGANYLNVKRNIYFINDGLKIYEFHDVDVVRISKGYLKYLSIAGIGAGFLVFCFIFLRKNLKKNRFHI